MNLLFKHKSKAYESNSKILFSKVIDALFMTVVGSPFKSLLISCCFVSIAISLSACESSKLEFTSFDSKKWQSSFVQKSNYRANVIDEMKSEFGKFHNLDEGELVNVLGKPDKTHLYTRGQKFFLYHLDDSRLDLKIRFNALGLVNEVLIWEN